MYKKMEIEKKIKTSKKEGLCDQNPLKLTNLQYILLNIEVAYHHPQKIVCATNGWLASNISVIII